MQNRDIEFMKLALQEAKLAAEAGEPPIGAVLVCDGEVLVAAHNHREREYDITSHAEIEVLRAAGKIKKDWRMSDCTLYVTLEPCPMCAGAMGSVLNLPRFPLGAHPVVEGGLLLEEARDMLQEFFKSKR